MQTNLAKEQFFYLRPNSPNYKLKGNILTFGRFLVGRAENCDFIIKDDSISAVHAVLEISPRGIKVFDMNSTNGTFLNDEKVVTQTLNLGDTLRFAHIAFKLEKYVPQKELPAILDALEPAQGVASTIMPSSDLPEVPSIPPTNTATLEKKQDVPYISFPLALDPKADNSEYIFEDADLIYPIFKYEMGHQSVEVMILFNDQVYSVDYLPEHKGVYHIVGANPKSKEFEFPYLGKTEKVAFVEISSGNCIVHRLHNYEMKHIADKVVSDAKAEHVNLQDNDLLHLKNGNLEIYVRRVPAPPKVKLAPFFRRDKDLKKYLLLMLFIMVIPLAGLNFLQVDEEKQKEKDPERIVRILYKQKLEVSKNKAVEKTPDKPKVAQTTPAKVVEKKVEPKKPTPVVAKPTPTPAKQDPGKKVETQPEPVKKAVAPTPVPTTTVAPPAKVVGAQTPVAKPAPTAKAVTDVKAAGVVDVYKSADFKSSLSSLMAKGGSVSGVKTTADTTAIGGANIGGSTSSDLKKADVASDVGSLTGAAVGKLGENKGAEGLSAKTGILTAGIPAETVVLGSMDPDVIRRILRDHLPQFRSCYQRELDRSAGQKVDGVIPIIFTIGASGSVSAAAVSGASQLSSGVKGCVVNVIKGIQFPRPQGGGTVEVKQPLNFQSSTLR